LDILSYPVGLLIGLFPVIVDLGTSPRPAELLLDGQPACTISARAPACTVDLGPDPVIHLLELVRKDKSGQVVESVKRWVNKPGVEAEVRAAGRCDGKTSTCDFTVMWAHPGKLDPASLTVALDGVTVASAVTPAVRVPFPRGSTPQVVTADATFPDGRRATFTQLLAGSYPERAEASLQAIPVVVPDGVRDDELVRSLKEAGWPVRAIELGGFEVEFVVEPGALASDSSFGLFGQSWPLQGAEQMRIIVANDTITAFQSISAEVREPAARGRAGSRASPGGIPGVETGLKGSSVRASAGGNWLRDLFRAPHSVPAVKRLRTSDAVALAGYDLGGSSRRRAIVLIAGSEREDESTFSPAQAQAYLGQNFVPFFVWRAAPRSAPGWPAGSDLKSFGANVSAVRKELDRQRIVWLEGRVDQRTFRPRLPPGVAIAGGGLMPDAPSEARRSPEATDKDTVFAVAVDPSAPQTVYAGTRKGVEVSRDGGSHWSLLRTGEPPIETYAVAPDPRGAEIFFGSSGAIGHSIAGGQSWALAPALPVFSILFHTKDPKMAFAGTRGGVFRTADGGTRWVPSEAGMEKTFALSLASDQQDPGVFYAATAGSGVFKSTDAGQSWKPVGHELERTVVRCIATDTAREESVYAGTDGGVFVSADRGKTWQRRSSGLPRAVFYALFPDPGDPARVFAGTAAGLFESRDGARSWNRIGGSDPDTQFTSLVLDASRTRLYAGTLGHGVAVVPVEPGGGVVK
jgi:photosystem II stability/assembly factor-like uncharacterized protein